MEVDSWQVGRCRADWILITLGPLVPPFLTLGPVPTRRTRRYFHYFFISLGYVNNVV